MSAPPIFVFGSNRAGRHGAGAALHAARNHGAQRGVGEGLTGNSYAIPTKDENLRVLPLSEIAESIGRFIAFAHSMPALTFHLTPVGCGLAGYQRADIIAILNEHILPRNILLTSSWITE